MNKKILVIQTAFLGDVILSLPMVQMLKKIMPEGSIDYLCIPHTAQVLQNNPYLRNVITYDKHRRGARDFLKTVSRIKGERYDIVICPHRSYRSALLTHLSQAKVRIGFDINPFSWLLTEVVLYDPHLHEIQREMELIKGFEFLKRDVSFKPELFPSESDKEVVEKLLKLVNSKVIAFAPCSKWFTKQIPETKARELTYDMIGLGFKVVLIGGKEDTEYCNELKNDIPDERLVNFCGRLTPLQSSYLIGKVSLLVTTDSAAMHLGAATDTPIAVVYGSTVPSLGFYPLTSRHMIMENTGLECRPCTDHGRRNCPLEHFKCMIEIEAKDVAGAVRELIISD